MGAPNEPRRFRGGVMRWPAQVGSGIGSMTLDTDEIVLTNAFRRHFVVRRSDVAAVEVREVRRLFMWRTEFRFVRRDEADFGHYFVPYRSADVRQGLIQSGWPVVATS